jgi:hypothetical protein
MIGFIVFIHFELPDRRELDASRASHGDQCPVEWAQAQC